MLLKITLKSYVFQGNAPSEYEHRLSTVGRGEENCQMHLALSEFTMQSPCSPAPRSPWYPPLDLLQYGDVCLVLGSPSQDMLQGSNCSLNSAKVELE